MHNYMYLQWASLKVARNITQDIYWAFISVNVLIQKQVAKFKFS